MALQERSNDILDQRLLITGISQLLTLRGSTARRGAALSKLGIVKDGAVLVRDGRIAAAGTRREVEACRESSKAEKLDVAGRVVLPGFVDSHTHLIHAASRAEEDLRYVQFPYDEVEKVLIQMGTPRKTATLFTEMFRAFNDGTVRPTETRSARNTTPTSIEKFVKERFVPAYQGIAVGA